MILPKFDCDSQDQNVKFLIIYLHIKRILSSSVLFFFNLYFAKTIRRILFRIQNLYCFSNMTSVDER